jgi:murein L,D-transpeptidase YafK
MLRSRFITAVLAASAAACLAVLGGCGQYSPAYLKPLSTKTRALIAEKGMAEDAPILIRVFKAESELEVWKQREDGHFYHLKTYPICSYSGGLGPKIKQGDKQAPEGFYLVAMEQLNPRSKYYLSFDLGFPNAFDRAYGRTGGNLMIHGDCTSSGCYAMTDGVMEEIFSLVREALVGGQANIQVHAFPFRMTEANLASQQKHEHYNYWRNLKEGYDYFEAAKLEPKITVCEKRYLFNAVFEDGTPRYSATGKCPRHGKGQIAAFKPLPKPKNVQVATTSKPLGSVLNLKFGPAKPAYTAFTLGPATPDLPAVKKPAQKK